MVAARVRRAGPLRADGDPADRRPAALDTWQRRIGFRTVALDTTPDAHGTPFTLVVNGVPVFVRGVNWIPDDAFPSPGSPASGTPPGSARRSTANVNLLRVWGGGLYECDDFYDLADELGLLVWQDFLFACAAYPEEEPLAARGRGRGAETSRPADAAPQPGDVDRQQREHLGPRTTGTGRQQLAGRTWGAGYYLDLLPAIVAELDPTRPYWPGSPYSGGPDRAPERPGARHHAHLGRVEQRRLHAPTATTAPRFVAEFGFQAPPAYATLRRALSDDPLTPDSPGMLAPPEGRRRQRQAAPRAWPPTCPAPRDFDDWHYLTQLNQARAMQLGLEHFRSLRPLCMGAIVWQLNDCWPVTSWAAVDGDGRRKPLWYALRRAYAPTGCSPSSRATAAWPWSRSTTPPAPWPGQVDGSAG